MLGSSETGSQCCLERHLPHNHHHYRPSGSIPVDRRKNGVSAATLVDEIMGCVSGGEGTELVVDGTTTRGQQRCSGATATMDDVHMTSTQCTCQTARPPWPRTMAALLEVEETWAGVASGSAITTTALSFPDTVVAYLRHANDHAAA